MLQSCSVFGVVNHTKLFCLNLIKKINFEEAMMPLNYLNKANQIFIEVVPF